MLQNQDNILNKMYSYFFIFTISKKINTIGICFILLPIIKIFLSYSNTYFITY